jgi:hypothetical protein
VEFPVKEVLGALVTFAVAGLGYLQWKRTRRSGGYIQDREAAYKAVWQSLEEIHLYVRGGAFDRSAFGELMRRTNTLLIQHGLHIEESDKREVARYIEALRRLGALFPELKSDEAAVARREFADTMSGRAVPPELIQAFAEYEAARTATMENFRRALGAGQI